MTRSSLFAMAALPATLLFGAGQTQAARPLLAELLARAPVAAGKPAMSPLALEVCLRQARELDRTGETIDYEIAAIDREAAKGKLQAGFPLYQQKQKAYDAAVADFDRDCGQGLTAGDLNAAKVKYGIK